MRRIAELVLRHRLAVVIVWGLLLVLGFVLVPKTNDRLGIDFSLPGQPGTDTANSIEQLLGNGGKNPPLIVTVTMPEGQTVTGNEREINRSFLTVQSDVDNVRVVDEANTGDDLFRTDDDRTAFAFVYWRFLHDPSAPLPTDDIRDAASSVAPDGSTVGVTGYDALAIGDESNGGPGVLLEVVIGGIGALLVLIFVFASFLAFLPLIVAMASIFLSFMLLLPLTYIADMSFIIEFLIALIGLGVAIDYSLILVNRWREERDHGRDNHDAVVVAMETAGHAVVFSGITVAIGLLALVVLPVPFMRSIGIGGALIPLASIITTLTLTPAILGSVGPKVDWPKIRHENRASKSWSRWARGVVDHRVASVVFALAALGFLVVAFTGVKIGLASTDSLASNGKAFDTYQILKDGGVGPGVLTPMEIPVADEKAADVSAQLASVDGVERVLQPTGPASNQLDRTVLIAIPDRETVNSSTLDPVRAVKDAVDGEDGVTGVAGYGPDQIDFLHAVYGNFPLMLGIITLLTFLLLARAFRSLLLPLKAVVLNLVTLAATLGFMVLFWQSGYGSDAIFGTSETGAVTFWIPLMVFAFLYGLSMDYEVFILSRIREEYDNGRSTDEAVIEGIGRTGRLVTSAALILFLAFVALASGPGTDLKTFASALGFGILIDATIVRSLLVPALVSLFGRWNWYLPAGFARVLRVRPSVPHEEVAVAD